MTFGKTSPFNGDKYEGDFVNGKPHGQGTYTKANGIVYTGQLKDGVPNGQGTATTPAGEQKTGTWENGKEVDVKTTAPDAPKSEDPSKGASPDEAKSNSEPTTPEQN